MAANSTPIDNSGSRHKVTGPGAGGEDGGPFQMPERVRQNPIDFLRPDDEARVHAIFFQPLDAQGYSLQKSGGIAY